MARGEWQNPADSLTEEERREIAILGGQARAVQHRSDIETGKWQNPAQTPEAREKLSRPRKYVNSPVLHSAIEKLRRKRMDELAPEEAKAYRQYCQAVRRSDPQRFRRYFEEAYRKRTATEERRKHLRERERCSIERQRARGSNEVLRNARLCAGLSLEQMASQLQVSKSAIWKWEMYSAQPRDRTTKERVATLLGISTELLWQTEGTEN